MTKTLIFVGCKAYGDKPVAFKKSNGNLYGADVWTVCNLCEPTDEIFKEIELQRLRDKAKRLYTKLEIPEDKDALELFVAALEKAIDTIFGKGK